MLSDGGLLILKVHMGTYDEATFGIGCKHKLCTDVSSDLLNFITIITNKVD